MSSKGSICVIGIDPGSQVTGWGVVRETSGVLHLVDCGAVRTTALRSASLANPASPANPSGPVAKSQARTAEPADFSTRLAHIYTQLAHIVGRIQPDEAAIEQVFTAKNAATALKLGQARGVAVAACAAHGLSVSDYPPTLVKKTLVGVGRAEKSQVAFMVARLLNTKAEWPLDTSDALAVAICHLTLRRYRMLLGK